jgi:hypothetical protein
MAEYTVPETAGTLPPREILGKFSKDSKDGYTSNFADILRQAKKTKGPGDVTHPDWTNAAKKSMGKYTSEPSYGTLHYKGKRAELASGPKGIPGPGQYTVRPADCVKDRAPNQPRLLKGSWSKAPKTWSLTPAKTEDPYGPGHRMPKFYKISETLHQSAPLLAESAKKTESRVPDSAKKTPPAPGTYSPCYSLLEKRELGGTWGRREVLQKVQQKRYTDICADAKKGLPDPGTYPLIKMDKISRGGKWSQVHGVARSPIHGTY